MSNASNFADRNVDALGETLREGAEHVKRTAEELISESADAVGEMADAIRSDETVRKVGKTVRRMATESRSYFERNDVDEIASDVVEAVRRHLKLWGGGSSRELGNRPSSDANRPAGPMPYRRPSLNR